MDWKRQTYIWQNSRRTNLSTSCVENHSRCHLGMLYRRKRERCWANPASGAPKSPGWPQNHLGGNWNSNSRLIKEGLCSRKSFAPSVCVGCVIQGVPKAGSAAHPTEAQREREGEQLCSYNSPTLRAVRGDKPRDFPPSDGSFASSSYLGLAIQVRELIHDTAGHNTSSHGKQLRKSKASY